ncbi:hypothetical protein GJ744_012039 [Endocarpon pusillum]|uniref:Uncharacterized protein n=1 Tax=Endocarpon pusillum TaxID=364733 RepID=A0A8H7EAP4_9EURO|nr:hypothetical protein GJ744_012039 [Endocarpon pusillum]
MTVTDKRQHKLMLLTRLFMLDISLMTVDLIVRKAVRDILAVECSGLRWILVFRARSRPAMPVASIIGSPQRRVRLGFDKAGIQNLLVGTETLVFFISQNFSQNKTLPRILHDAWRREITRRVVTQHVQAPRQGND